MSTTYVLVADRRTGAVGCVLFQAMFGGTVPIDTLALFEWETTEIEYMTPYRITESQLDALIARRRREGTPTI